MVIDIVPKLMEPQDVVKIIPGDAAERELADQAADDDTKFLIRPDHALFAPRSSKTIDYRSYQVVNRPSKTAELCESPML